MDLVVKNGFWILIKEKKKAPGIPPSAATKSTVKQCFNVLKQIMNSESVAKVMQIEGRTK